MILNTTRTSALCSLVLIAGTAMAATPKPIPAKGKAPEAAATPKPKPAPKGKAPVVVVELTQTGKTLEAKYADLLESLKGEITKQLPAVDQAKVAAWLAAIQAEEGFAKEAKTTAGAVAKLQKTAVTLAQLEETAKKAPQTYKEAKEELADAKAAGKEDPEMDKLLASEQTFLDYIKKEQAKLNGKIDKARVAAKDAEAALPAAIKAAEAAKQAYGKAMANTWKAMDALGTSGILSSAQLDGKLAQYMVINDATPRGLAEFAEKSPEHEKLIQQLLADKDLMVQMLVADGPNSGKYGEAMKIYTDIQKASAKAKEGLFQRLALAVSLGHAVPIKQRNAVSGSDDDETSDATAPDNKDASAYIDPVKRYLSYEKWYLAGELDQGFKNLSVWNLALAVDGTDPDEVYAWGRQMLRNLRPDCIPNDGDTSVYVNVVDKEIAYTSSMLKDDRPDLAFMQNILANGGICGRRAFFGRFTLRAFGVPTTARKQPGHATLAHWHPDGWKTKLGGNWGIGARGNYSSMNRARSSSYGADINFQASSQAREDATAFMKVKRAQWIGELTGEPRKPGLITFSGKSRGSSPKKGTEIEKPIFWNDVALQEQRRIVDVLESASAKASSPAPVVAKVPGATGKVTVDDKGVITIPSAACSTPTESVFARYKSGAPKDLIVFLKDNKSGETRLHVSRFTSEADSFEYTFDAPKAGKYQLVATVVTPKWDQRLFATANGSAPVEMALPYTIGMWDNTAPVAIELKAGKNVLKFHGPARVTIGTFKLTPAK
jgi:chemotaxis protein histidine kinase CheA